MPRVSVIIPAYNAGAFLVQALSSVQSQTICDWEAIVVDDGSTDDTASIVRRFADSSRTLQNSVQLIQQANRGVSAARNRGLAAASSPWVAFLDADDVWDRGKLESQLRAADEEQADLIFGPVDLIGQGRPRDYPQRRYLLQGRSGLRGMVSRNHVPSSTVMARRALLEQAGGFDESLSVVEDYDLWMRLLLEGARFCYEPLAVAGYRLHVGSLSAAKAKMRRAMRGVLRKRPLPSVILNLQRHAKMAELFVSEQRHLLSRRKAA